MRYRDGKFFTTERISPQKEKTPEGYLLCRDVPISRVGVFEYNAAEAGMSGGGRVHVNRSSDELFNQDTISSFEGKPVVISHARFADPDNWRDIAVGTVQNVRRGTADKSDFLLADLLLTDRKAIEAVERGELKEVSCGYDAETENSQDGINQVGIVGNHVALVVSARCSGCKIGDGSMTKNFKTRLRKWFRDGDEDSFNEELDKLDITDSGAPAEAEQPAAPDALSLEDRLTKLEAAVDSLIKSQRTADSEAEAAQDQLDQEQDRGDQIVEDETASRIVADADLLCPGMKKPIGDAKGGKFTRNHLERIMRTALKGSGSVQFGDSAELEGKALDIAFKAALELSRAGRNPKAGRYGDSADGGNTIESIQKKLNDFWGAK